MSTGLFRSRQFKSRKNLKKLSISAPLSNGAIEPISPVTPTSTLSNPVVILKAKYDFHAESDRELAVKHGDFLRLIDRPGNGWLLVKFIDNTDNTRGLIPASYVDIAVNDQTQPVTREWLNVIHNNKVNELKKFPTNIQIFHAKNYTVDCTMNDGSKVFVDKHYGDFSDLHTKLAGVSREFNESLPQLSESETQRFIVKINSYFSKMLEIPSLQKSHELTEFIFKEDKHEIHHAAVTQLASPTSPVNPHSSFSVTAPLPRMPETPTTPKSGNNASFANVKYSSYMNQKKTEKKIPESTSSQTISSFTSLIAGYDKHDEDDEDDVDEQPSTGTETEDTSVYSSDLDYKKHSVSSEAHSSVFSKPTTPSANHEFEDQLAPLTPATPIEKSPIRRTTSGDYEYIKIKVLINSLENDMVALKMKKTNLISIAYLKKLISNKIYKDYNLVDHYRLQVNDKDAMTDDELLHYIKNSSKVCLKIVRKR